MSSRREEIKEEILALVNLPDYKPITKKAIAKRLHESPSTICYVIDSLEDVRKLKVNRVTEKLHLVEPIK